MLYRLVLALLLALTVWVAPDRARGHELNSASLALVETTQGRFDVRWQASSPTLMRELKQPALFPPPCQLRGDTLDCGAQGLAGTIRFPWLEGSETRVVVQIDRNTGSRLMRVVDGRSPNLSVYGIPPTGGLRLLKPVAVDYTRLGIEHILTGFDHLLFVLALTLLVHGGRRLFATVTAFTLAHSITLGCTALGWVEVPSAPVEATIALSIVLVCTECIRQRESVTRRAPWLVSFAFGLLHGFGFASSLLAIGLPEQHVSAALLFFNLGVELGQLGAIAAFLTMGWAVRRLHGNGRWSLRTLTYTMGVTAAFWSIERIWAIFA